MIFWSDGGNFSGGGSCESIPVALAEELFDFFGSAPAIAKLDDSGRYWLRYGFRSLSYRKREHLLPSALLGLGIYNGICFLKYGNRARPGLSINPKYGASACEASVIIEQPANIKLPIDPQFTP